MEVLLDRNKILMEILDTIKTKAKEYESVRSKHLANLYLGQLSGFETAFYIISSKGGQFDDDTTKTYEEFKREHERLRQILVEKIAVLHTTQTVLRYIAIQTAPLKRHNLIKYIERNTNMNLVHLKEILTQENIFLKEVLYEIQLQEIQGMTWIPSPLPYPGYTTPPRFGFMSKLEILAQPLI